VVFRVPAFNKNNLALDFDEDLSSLGANSFDYVRMAHVNGAVMDERALLGKVFGSVSPQSDELSETTDNVSFSLAVLGTGHIEMTFVDWTFQTANPGPLPSNCPVARLQELLAAASRKRGIALNPDAAKIDGLIMSTGFTDRIHRTHTLPLCTWSLDRCQRLIGERMQGLLAWRIPDADHDGFFEGLSLELLTRWLGMTPEAVRELTA